MACLDYEWRATTVSTDSETTRRYPFDLKAILRREGSSFALQI
jgi:hypothetical protein